MLPPTVSLAPYRTLDPKTHHQLDDHSGKPSGREGLNPAVELPTKFTYGGLAGNKGIYSIGDIQGLYSHIPD